MANKEKKQQVANNTFQELKPDPESVLFSEKKIDERFLKKLKKYSYSRDNFLLRPIYLTKQKINNENKARDNKALIKP